VTNVMLLYARISRRMRGNRWDFIPDRRSEYKSGVLPLSSWNVRLLSTFL
jgi:hypothetical protein